MSRQVPQAAAAVVSQSQFEVPQGSCWGQPCCEALHLVLACTMQSNSHATILKDQPGEVTTKLSVISA